MFGRVNVSLYLKKSQFFRHDRVAAVRGPAESRSVVSVDGESALITLKHRHSFPLRLTEKKT